MRGIVVDRLGALVEREYRLLFSATLITSLGDAIATIALVFAVLDVGSATDLGIVLAVRQVASAAMLLLGGVLSDRMARNRVLVGASLLQGVAQAAMAASVLSGRASLASFAALGVLWGLGDGLVVPAETGLVPQTVSSARLQQANALQGLSRSGVRVLGPAIGGVLVVTLGSGWALAVDSLSFFACAALLGRIRIAPRPDSIRERFVSELRDGWREFRSRAWLWSTVLVFGVGNMFFVFWQVLGPAIAEQRLGGAGAWATILAAGGIGAILGGLWALRHNPGRPLVACILWPLCFVPQLAALATGAPTWLVATASLASGFGIAIHVALWFTVFQREVPERARSRVASYDALGSFVLSPVGAAIAGPVAIALGNAGALWLAAAVILACNLTMLMIPAVWTIRRPEPRAVAAAIG
ncbi:MAG: MFS transporter [Solirubrobacteraceae bacterium]